MKASKEYLKKNGIPENNRDFEAIKDLLKNNTGYMYMFTIFRYEEGRSISMLIDLFNKLQTNKNVLKELPKPAANYRDYQELQRDLDIVLSTSAIKQFIQVCPSDLKQVIRDHQGYWNRITNACEAFVKLDRTKQRLFTASISRYKSFSEISRALNNFIDYVKDARDIFSIIDQAQKMKGVFIRVVYMENQRLVLRITNETAIAHFGKGTSWCIAEHPHSHFRSYVENNRAIQYIAYDFSKPHTDQYHRLGITSRNGRITNAHAYGNSAINIERELPQLVDMSWLKHYNDDNEARVENIIEDIQNSNTSSDQLTRQIQEIAELGYLDKFMQTGILSKNKAAKVYGEAIRSTIDETNEETYNRMVVQVYDMIDSTKFFNEFIPTLHKLNVETAIRLKNKGLFFKYSVHLDEILEKYFLTFNTETTTDVVEREGVKFKRTITFTPLYSMPLEVLDVLLSTNKDVVTNKSLRFANDINNLELFRVLAKHFNGSIRSVNKFQASFLEELNLIVNEREMQNN